jgi:UPF0755 protein
VRRGCRAAARLVAFLILTGAFLGSIFAYLILTPKGVGPEKYIFIPEGASGNEVAALLEREGIIRNAFAFRILLRASGRGGAIQSGKYRLSPSAPPLAILKSIIEGDRIRQFFTIPEGYTSREIASVLEKAGICSASSFLALVRQNPGIAVDEGLVPESLEGYLFPDTYEVPLGAGASSAAKMMVNRFREVVIPIYRRKPGKLSLAQAVILASLVEREAKVAGERPVIAAVYLNRLAAKMPLQCDATVQFALGQPKPLLTFEDLRVESPYNTYLHPGLPPGPICNPGMASIRAVLEPSKVPYLYYVLDERKRDGSHLFSRTYMEHLEAIRKSRRKR